MSKKFENICFKCYNSIKVKRAVIVNLSEDKDEHKDVVVENTTYYCVRKILRDFIASSDTSPIVECQLFMDEGEKNKNE